MIDRQSAVTRRGAWVAAMLLLGPPAGLEAQTNGFVLHCLSARAAAQGCVSRGQTGVPTSAFADPAGIVDHARPTLELNLTAFTPSLRFDNPANPAARGALHSYPMGSVAFVGPTGVEGLAWGAAMVPIGGFGSDFVLAHPLLGPGQDHESFFAGVKAGPVLAYELAPGLSVGASASLLYARIVEFRMPFTMPPAGMAGLQALAGLDPHYPALFSQFTEVTAYGDSEGFAGTGLGADVGVSYRRGGLKLSASWNPKTVLEMDGATVVMDMSRQFEQMFGALVQERVANHGESPAQAQQSVAQLFAGAGLDPSLAPRGTYAGATELSLPQMAGLGGTYSGSAWKLGAEVVWMNWSDAAFRMPFILTAGDNPNMNLLIAADPANGSFTYPLPLEWSDTWSLRGGGELAVAERVTLRAGFIAGENPVPAHTVFIAFPAIATNAITAGATVRLGRIPVDLSVVHAPQKELRGSATGHRYGSEYHGSVSGLSQTVVTIGVIRGF